MSRKVLTEISTKNKDIKTSFVYTWARQKDMSLLEQRVVLRIIEYASNCMKGILFKDNMQKINLGLSNVQITMPVTAVLFKTKMKHKDIENSLKTLRNRYFEYKENDEYVVCGFINKARYSYGSGLITVEVDNQLWNVLSDLSSGYRKFELNKALALPTSTALQFYMLLSGQDHIKFYFSISELKNWLGIAPEKYRQGGKDRVDHLEERVLKPIKKILDETCPYSFTYEKIRQNKDCKNSPVVAFEIIPVCIPKNRDMELERTELSGKVSIGFIAPQVTQYMIQIMNIPRNSLAPHKDLIMRANRLLPDLMGTLEDIQGRRRVPDGPDKGIGWVIQAIRGEVENAEKILLSHKKIT